MVFAKGANRVDNRSRSFRLDGRGAVVTGAASGRGVAFAQALAEAGADLVPAARRTDRLDSTKRPAWSGSTAGRTGDPGELAAAVVFLPSPAAGYVTGTTLVVDAGSRPSEDVLKRNWAPLI